MAAHIIEHVQKVILTKIGTKAGLDLSEYRRALFCGKHILRAIGNDVKLRLLGIRTREARHLLRIICRNLKDERVCAAGKTLLGLGCAHLAPCELIRIEERIDEVRAGLHVPAVCVDRALVEIHHRHGNPA
ncbi:unknown [Collinsella sp. CAG:398]|nr:unknown [Collinsella sp. CAG:398]